MSPNEFNLLAYACQAIVALCSISFITDLITNRKIQKRIGGMVIFFLLVGGYFSYQGKKMEVGLAKKSEKEAKNNYDTLYQEMKTLRHRDSVNFANLDNSIRKYGFERKGFEIVPITENSTHVTSIGQTGGQTGVNFTNNY